MTIFKASWNLAFDYKLSFNVICLRDEWFDCLWVGGHSWLDESPGSEPLDASKYSSIWFGRQSLLTEYFLSPVLCPGSCCSKADKQNLSGCKIIKKSKMDLERLSSPYPQSLYLRISCTCYWHLFNLPLKIAQLQGYWNFFM